MLGKNTISWSCLRFEVWPDAGVQARNGKSKRQRANQVGTARDKVVLNVGDDVRSLIVSDEGKSETPYVVSYNNR